jgi:integrase
VNGGQVMRRLGSVRAGARDGLTRSQAEAELRRAIEASRTTRPLTEGLDLAEAGKRYLANREAIGLKPGTLSDYESYLRVHLLPFFGRRPLEQITPDDVEAFIAAKRQEGKAVKSILNYVGLLNTLFAHGTKRGWCSNNPVKSIDKPRDHRDPEIRFLDQQELEALLDAVPDDLLGSVERVLYLAAAMTGMRRGELLALRWRDIDWNAGLIRVRRTYTRGQFGTPKTRRSSRAVPLADRLREELRRHERRSRYQSELDLVFCHPHSGCVLDPSRLRRRFQDAARRAGLRPVRFHDLRHTFGTRMAAAGAPLRAIQEWLGHSDYRTTSIYADYAPDATQAAVWAARAFPLPPLTAGIPTRKPRPARAGRSRPLIHASPATSGEQLRCGGWCAPGVAGVELRAWPHRRP